MRSSKPNPAKKPAASSSATAIPSDLSFLIRIVPLAPNYAVQENRKLAGPDYNPNRFWAPPNIRQAYYHGNETLFRWKGGIVTAIAANDPVRRLSLTPHSVATVFTQCPDTPHLLAVNFDAQTRDVREQQGGWKVLSFRHIEKDPNNTYSSLDLLGDQAHLAAHGSQNWVPQLLPNVYDYQEVDLLGRPISPKTRSAGLIGSLPLLIALAAFSAPQDVLADALRSIQPGEWHPHGHPSGRNVGERGMVVTIFYDPSNSKGSNETLLNRLQDGHYGPFYR